MICLLCQLHESTFLSVPPIVKKHSCAWSHFSFLVIGAQFIELILVHLSFGYSYFESYVVKCEEMLRHVLEKAEWASRLKLFWNSIFSGRLAACFLRGINMKYFSPFLSQRTHFINFLTAIRPTCQFTKKVGTSKNFDSYNHSLKSLLLVLTPHQSIKRVYLYVHGK